MEIAAAENGVARDFTLPPLTDLQPEREGPPDVEALVEVWRGREDARAEAAIVGTMALALGLMGAAPQEALAEARALWAARDREHFLKGAPARAESCRRRRWAKSISSARGPARRTC